MATQREVDEERAVWILSRLAGDMRESPAVRVAACRALTTYMPCKEVVDALGSVLQREGEVPEVRIAATLALGRS